MSDLQKTKSRPFCIQMTRLSKPLPMKQETDIDSDL